MEDQTLQKPYDIVQPPRSMKRSRRLVLIIFLFIVIAGAAYGATTYLGGSGEKKAEVAPTPTPQDSEIEFVVETPAVGKEIEETALSEATSTPTPQPTINPVDKETGLDRSEISIEVLNGSGVTGAASKASETLKGFGYKISSIGNADSTDYENVTIRIKGDKDKFLDLLKKDLGFSYTVGSASANLSDDASSDAVVIIGK